MNYLCDLIGCISKDNKVACFNNLLFYHLADNSIILGNSANHLFYCIFITLVAWLMWLFQITITQHVKEIHWLHWEYSYKVTHINSWIAMRKLCLSSESKIIQSPLRAINRSKRQWQFSNFNFLALFKFFQIHFKMLHYITN